MMIHEITEKVGRHKRRKRIGRGHGSGHGKTSGRGHKGARSRAGFSMRPGQEGGQMPLFRRLPKRGFNNANFRKDFAIVNLQAIEARFENGEEVTPESLAAKGLIPGLAKPVKVLGHGELTKKVTVTAAAFSKSAKEKITSAGGSANEAA